MKVRSTETNLIIDAKTDSKGSYLVPNLPIGDYEVSFSQQNFQTESHPDVVVRAGGTSTVNGSLQIGSMSSTVQVSGTPLMNQVDTTNGYTVDQLTIQNTRLAPAVLPSLRSSALVSALTF